MRRDAGGTPGGNGRAVNFDHLGRHKRTRADILGVRNASPVGNALKASHGSKIFFIFSFGNNFWEMSKSIGKISFSIVS
jgi:hypothetical protein